MVFNLQVFSSKLLEICCNVQRFFIGLTDSIIMMRKYWWIIQFMFVWCCSNHTNINYHIHKCTKVTYWWWLILILSIITMRYVINESHTQNHTKSLPQYNLIRCKICGNWYYCTHHIRYALITILYIMWTVYWQWNDSCM